MHPAGPTLSRPIALALLSAIAAAGCTSRADAGADETDATSDDLGTDGGDAADGDATGGGEPQPWSIPVEREVLALSADVEARLVTFDPLAPSGLIDRIEHLDPATGERTTLFEGVPSTLGIAPYSEGVMLDDGTLAFTSFISTGSSDGGAVEVTTIAADGSGVDWHVTLPNSDSFGAPPKTDGQVLLVPYITPGTTAPRSIALIDGDGSILWSFAGGTGATIPRIKDAAFDDDEIVLVGETQMEANGPFVTWMAWLSRTDGTITRELTLTETELDFTGVSVTPGGTMFVAANSSRNPLSAISPVLARIDRDGAVVWSEVTGKAVGPMEITAEGSYHLTADPEDRGVCMATNVADTATLACFELDGTPVLGESDPGSEFVNTLAVFANGDLFVFRPTATDTGGTLSRIEGPF